MKNLWKTASKEKLGKFVFQQNGPGEDMNEELPVDQTEKVPQEKDRETKAKELAKKYSKRALWGILKLPVKLIKSLSKFPTKLIDLTIGFALGVLTITTIHNFFKENKIELTTKEKKDFTIFLEALRKDVFKIGTVEIYQGVSFEHTFKDTIFNSSIITIENPYTERTLTVLAKGKGLMGFDAFYINKTNNGDKVEVNIIVPEPKIISMETININFDTDKNWGVSMEDEEQSMMTMKAQKKLKEKMNNDSETKKIAKKNFREYMIGLYKLQAEATGSEIKVNVEFIPQKEFDSKYKDNPNLIKNDTKVLTAEDFKD